MAVRDVNSGTLLVTMKFTGLSDALYYLTEAKLECSDCGRIFSGSSTITMMKRGDWWELMVPHNCETHPVQLENAPRETQPASTHNSVR